MSGGNADEWPNTDYDSKQECKSGRRQTSLEWSIHDRDYGRLNHGGSICVDYKYL